MGVVKIENRGKNLWNYTPQQYIDNFPSNRSYYYVVGDVLYVGASGAGSGFPFLVVKPNTVYTFQCEKLDNKQFRVELYTFSGKFLDKTFTNSGIVKFTFTAPNDIIFVKFHNNSNTTSTPVTNFMLIEGDYTNQELDYEPPRNDYIELNQELFGYNGVYDEVLDDGTLIKRWQKETGRTVTLGSASVTKSGTGTCILVNETNGEVYEGTVSGTNISTSAPDGTYTVIYQLATPVISTVSFSGSGLILDKGDNNIILPDYGVMELEYEGTGTSQESLIYMQDLRIREEASYREYQPVNSKYTKSIQTGKKYSISIGQVYFERSMADKLDKDTRFTLEVNKENEDGRTETDRYVNCRLNSVEETDSNGLRMESVDITAEAKEVVA